MKKSLKNIWFSLLAFGYYDLNNFKNEKTYKDISNDLPYKPSLQKIMEEEKQRGIAIVGSGSIGLKAAVFNHAINSLNAQNFSVTEKLSLSNEPKIELKYSNYRENMFFMDFKYSKKRTKQTSESHKICLENRLKKRRKKNKNGKSNRRKNR